MIAAVALLPSASAAPELGYTDLNSPRHSYTEFVATPVNGSDDDGAKVLADVNNFRATALEYAAWVQRADQIRLSGDPRDCVGNLSLALAGVGAAYQAGSSGATTLLTLLPTTGALIGAPAKELWVLYKLMPLAGVLSMFLSLGGNIVPMEVNDYEQIDSFEYGAMIGSKPHEKVDGTPEEPAEVITNVESFAREVEQRARADTAYNKSMMLTLGIILQLFWLGCILNACWFLQTGSIIVWWCTMKPWTYLWYIFVAVSSLLENLAGVPFTKQWTIRVSRAPSPLPYREEIEQVDEKHDGASQASVSGKAPMAIDDIIISTHRVASSLSTPSLLQQQKARYTPLPQQAEHWPRGEVLARLEKGYNTYGRIVMEPGQPWSASTSPLYVIVSVRGVSNAHATLRVFSKFLSIAVFTVGTATFASSTLVTILVVVNVACLIICAGVFGRVTAMWMASQIMLNKPVIHRVVKDRFEAEEYIEAMLRKPNMVCEINGHVIVEGRCVKRYSKHLRWSKFLGVLAKPYDLSKLAMPHFSSA